MAARRPFSKVKVTISFVLFVVSANMAATNQTTEDDFAQLKEEPLHTVVGKNRVRVYEEIASSGSMNKGTMEWKENVAAGSNEAITNVLLLAIAIFLICQCVIICAVTLFLNAKINRLLQKDTTDTPTPNGVSSRAPDTLTRAVNTIPGEDIYESIDEAIELEYLSKYL